MHRVAALIIAAGSSSRLGQPKQLLLLKGEPLLQRAIRMCREAEASPVFVVLGAHREEIESRISFERAQVVPNNQWEEGMASSIHAGIRAIEKEYSETSGVLLAICDQPRLTSDHLRNMIRAFSQTEDATIASTYGGKRGIPVIFPRAAFGDLLGLKGDKGARTLLANPSRALIEIPFEGGEIDIDLPGDIAHLQTF